MLSKAYTDQSTQTKISINQNTADAILQAAIEAAITSSKETSDDPTQAINSNKDASDLDVGDDSTIIVDPGTTVPKETTDSSTQTPNDISQLPIRKAKNTGPRPETEGFKSSFSFDENTKHIVDEGESLFRRELRKNIAILHASKANIEEKRKAYEIAYAAKQTWEVDDTKPPVQISNDKVKLALEKLDFIVKVSNELKDWTAAMRDAVVKKLRGEDLELFVGFILPVLEERKAWRELKKAEDAYMELKENMSWGRR